MTFDSEHVHEVAVRSEIVPTIKPVQPVTHCVLGGVVKHVIDDALGSRGPHELRRRRFDGKDVQAFAHVEVDELAQSSVRGEKPSIENNDRLHSGFK